MNFSIADFTQVARNNWFNNDIVVSKDGSHISSKFFHTKSTKTSAQVTNEATRKAFQEALVTEFGSYGQEAFENLLKTRGGKSLRKTDILDTVKHAEFAKARMEGSIKAVAEETIGKILRDLELPYHSKSEETQAAIRKRTMVALTEMVGNEVSRGNILREIKSLPKNFEARVALLVKLAVKEMPAEAVKAPKESPAAGAKKAVALDPEQKAYAARLRERFQEIAEDAWSHILHDPSYHLSHISEKSLKHEQQQAFKALNELMKDDAVVLRLQRNYEKDATSIDRTMSRLADVGTALNLDDVLELD